MLAPAYICVTSTAVRIQNSPMTPNSHALPAPEALATTDLSSVTTVLIFGECQADEIIQFVPLVETGFPPSI